MSSLPRNRSSAVWCVISEGVVTHPLRAQLPGRLARSAVAAPCRVEDRNTGRLETTRIWNCSNWWRYFSRRWYSDEKLRWRKVMVRNAFKVNRRFGEGVVLYFFNVTLVELQTYEVIDKLPLIAYDLTKKKYKNVFSSQTTTRVVWR